MPHGHSLVSATGGVVIAGTDKCLLLLPSPLLLCPLQTPRLIMGGLLATSFSHRPWATRSPLRCREKRGVAGQGITGQLCAAGGGPKGYHWVEREKDRPGNLMQVNRGPSGTLISGRTDEQQITKKRLFFMNQVRIAAYKVKTVRNPHKILRI